MRKFKGFTLQTVGLFGLIYWYGIKANKATGNYNSEAALCEAIRTRQLCLTPLPRPLA